MAAIEVNRSCLRTQLRPLTAVQFLRTLRGGTQAHLMRASDGDLYAVKFQNNPFSARSLASEFLATRLGLWLGLPMPHIAVIEVPDWLVNHELLRIEIDDEKRLVRCATGRQLGIRYLAHALTALPKSVRDLTNRQDLIRVVPFDQWTANCDNRQVIFVEEKKRNYRAVFIDQHNCFNAGRWTFPDFFHYAVYEQAHVYADVTGWSWFEPILSRIEKISRFDLWKIATEIPPEWYQHDTESLSRLIERLYKRRLSVRELIDQFRTSDTNPFPRWKGN